MQDLIKGKFMTPQTNKNLALLAQQFTVKSSEVNTYYDEIRDLDETTDLLFMLKQNLNSITQAEKRLGFMIKEVRSTVKKKI